MAIGNSPSSASTSNTSTTSTQQNAGASSGAQGNVYGAQISGNTGTINTSDYGALRVADDIALSGLNNNAAQSAQTASFLQDALNKNQALASQVQSGGLTTILVPALWVGGALGALWIGSKILGKKA